MASILQQTKHNGINRDEFSTVSIYDIYNNIVFPLSKLFIDIRSKEYYMKAHVNHAIHLPTTVSDDDIKRLFKDKFFFSTIYCYANKHQIDKNEDIKFYNRIQSILINQLNENEHKFYILNSDIEIFINQFPYLCVENDDIYWNATINVKAKRTKKQKQSVSKHKTQRINMIDIYYQRLHHYQQYPNQIINDTLYLGMLSQASKQEILDNLQITHIINVTPTDYEDMSVINNRKYYQIKISDIKQVCIADYFENAFKFIEDARNSNIKYNDDNKLDTDTNESKDNDTNNDKYINKQNRILIHCKEGVSRSATIVIAYIMKTNKMTLDKALEFVKQRREVVDPNDGFMQQLRDFEKNGYSVRYKQY